MRHLAIFLAVAMAAAGCVASAPPTALPPADSSPGTQPTDPPSPGSPQAALPTLPPDAVAVLGELRSDAARAPAETASQAALDALVAADMEFALRLYLEVATGEDGDVFLSPYSISTALSMAYAGARATTAEQMAAVLGIELDPEEWHAARNRLELEMIARAAQPPPQGGDPLTLDPTNAIFGQAGFPFEDDYLRILAEYYGAGMQTLDFRTAPEAARNAISRWVAEKTRDRIEELLGPRTIDALTRAVLVNAIYFKGSWVHAFDPEATRPRPFHVLDGSQRDVEMMHARLETTYAKGDGWQAVRLPYFGASMLVIMPDAGQFASVESGLSAGLLADIEGLMKPHEVDLGLPRWESEGSIGLGDIVKRMGMTDAFDPNLSDLTGVAPVDDLYVSDVIHQANITVDEEGTEAAAATAVVMRVTSAGPTPPRVSLTVDRPFLYFIQDDATGEILFIGRLLTP